MFIFFWVNSLGTYATYYLMTRRSSLCWQHLVYVVANAGMYVCFVTASVTECGLVPTGGKQQVEHAPNRLTLTSGPYPNLT